MIWESLYSLLDYKKPMQTLYIHSTTYATDAQVLTAIYFSFSESYKTMHFLGKEIGVAEPGNLFVLSVWTNLSDNELSLDVLYCTSHSPTLSYDHELRWPSPLWLNVNLGMCVCCHLFAVCFDSLWVSLVFSFQQLKLDSISLLNRENNIIGLKHVTVLIIHN